jgi:hypothetical protein
MVCLLIFIASIFSLIFNLHEPYLFQPFIASIVFTAFQVWYILDW